MESLETGGTATSPGIDVADPNATVSDTWFDREWALATMDRALEQVKMEFEKSNRLRHFEILKPWLTGDSEVLSQTEAAAELGMTTGAIKVAIHRLRKNFREAIRSEIAQTVNDPEEVTEELRYLIEVLS